MDNSANLSNSEKNLALNGTEATTEQEPLKKLYVVRKDAQREKKGGKPWCCDLGAKLSSSGKRVRRYFSSRKDAEEEGRLSQKAYHELRRLNVEPENSLFYSRLVKILEDTDILPEVAATLVKEMWETVKNVESKKPEYFRACFKEGYLSLERKKQSVTFEKASFHLREENEKKQKAGHLRERSSRNTEDILKRFLKANPKISKKYLSELSKEELEKALENAVPESATSRKKMRAVLSTVFSFGINRGWCKENPVKFISVPLVKEEEIVCLNPEKVLSLLKACRIPTQEEKELQVVGNLSWMRGMKMDCRDCLPAVAIMIFTGMRPEEVKRLKWEDVNFETGMIHVEPKVSKKTGGMRALTMNETLRKWLFFFTLDIIPQALLDSSSWAKRFENFEEEVESDRRYVDSYSSIYAMPSEVRGSLLNAGKSQKVSKLNRSKLVPKLMGSVIPDRWDEKWAGVRRRAGFDKWQPDCLRHTFATMHLLKYSDYNTLMVEMGHADADLIRHRYQNTRGLSKRDAEYFWMLPCCEDIAGDVLIKEMSQSFKMSVDSELSFIEQSKKAKRELDQQKEEFAERMKKLTNKPSPSN